MFNPDDVLCDWFQQYLKNFGYLRPSSEEVISEESISEAITRFQSFAGINVTGDKRSCLGYVANRDIFIVQL